jgi:hypothetical protein
MKCKKAANLTYLSSKCNSLPGFCIINLSAGHNNPVRLTAKISQLAGFGNRLSGLNLFTTDAKSFLGLLPACFPLRQDQENSCLSTGMAQDSAHAVDC